MTLFFAAFASSVPRSSRAFITIANRVKLRDLAERLDGELHTKTGASALRKSRLGTEALADISNVDEHGEILPSDDRRRMYGLGNRLWHTDASFQDPPGRYSMLNARVVPPVGAETEFADMRAAYDALDAQTRARLEGLHVHHSISYSRQTLGFEFSKDEQEALKGAVHPLVRTLPRMSWTDGITDGKKLLMSLSLIAATARGAPEQFYLPADLAQALSREHGVPVVDGVACAVRLAYQSLDSVSICEMRCGRSKVGAVNSKSSWGLPR